VFGKHSLSSFIRATLDGASYPANNKTAVTMGRRWFATALTGLLAASLVSGEEAYTPKHEAGRCAIRGNCGKQSFFGSELPCPDNGLAKDPTKEVREQLIGICGAKWNTGPVCCEAEQVSLYFFKHVWNLLIMLNSLLLSRITSRKRMRSYLLALPVKRTSITSSVHSHAPRINRCL
jgi:hypothetical protein